MTLYNDQIQEVLKALIGKSTENFGDSLQSEFGIRALAHSNDILRYYRNELFKQK